jgi:hypothetical protein
MEVLGWSCQCNSKCNWCPFWFSCKFSNLADNITQNPIDPPSDLTANSFGGAALGTYNAIIDPSLLNGSSLV